MQAAVAENVSQYIRAEATSDEIERLQMVPTKNSEAYMLYLEGYYQIQVLANSNLENSIAIFEKAIALDSTFIEPHLALGDNYLLAGLVWGIYNEQEAWSKAKPYFQKALVLDSLKGGRQNRKIMSSLTNGKFHFEWDIESMERFFNAEKARLNPFVGLGYNDYSRKMGRFQDAMFLIDQIISDDPNRSVPFMSKGVLYYFMGEDEKALAIFETHNTTSSNNYFYLMETAKYYYYMDKIDLSKQQLQQLLNNFDDRPPIVLWLMAIHAQLEENTTVLSDSMENLRSKFNENSSGSPAWFIALYYCHTKDYEKAFEWLEKSYNHHEVEMMWLKEEPMLRPLRTDPRYIDLYDRVGFSKILPITPYAE
jgi:tetratricopeptide (TPR) repeat protein